MNKWVRRLGLVALVSLCAVAISCDSGGGSDGGGGGTNLSVSDSGGGTSLQADSSGQGSLADNLTVPVDTTPDPFDFVDVPQAKQYEVVYSNEITVTGINSQTFISISGFYLASYMINGAGPYHGARWIQPGDKVKLYMYVYDSAVGSHLSCKLTIGEVEDYWFVTVTSN